MALTESEWLSGTNPRDLLRHLRGKASDRKLRLFGHACWHRLRHLLKDYRLERFLDLIALSADDRVSPEERAAAQAAAAEAAGLSGGPALSTEREREASRRLTRWGLHWMAMETARASAWAAQKAAAWIGDWAVAAEMKAQCDLLRELFGNPFRPTTMDPSWLTWNGGTIGKLARVIYDERRFADLPILADALEEAGCGDVDLLAHCRGQADHVPRCWGVALLLGQ